MLLNSLSKIFSAITVMMGSSQSLTIDEDFILIGDYDAVSLYNSTESFNFTYSASDLNVYQLSTTNNSITVLPDTKLPGVPSIWQLINNSTSIMIIDNKPYIYNFQNSSLVQLKNWNNIKGDIKSFYYDEDLKSFYFGGSISFNDTHGIVQYDYQEEQLLSLPFGGFNENSTINSIVQLEGSSDLILAGSFNSIGYVELLNITLNETETNTTSYRNQTGVIDISQSIPILSQDVSASVGENAQDIICPVTGNNGWLLSNGELGTWSASLQTKVRPSKIRLYNSNSENTSVNTFRIITYPANGIMNMTYIDPYDLQEKHCDAFCPLFTHNYVENGFQNNSIRNNQYYKFTNDNQTIMELTDVFQDFAFVNPIEVESFSVEIMNYHGSNAELAGVELYGMGISVFANNSLNLGNSCSSSGGYHISVNSESLGGMSWKSGGSGGFQYSEVPSNQVSNNKGISYDINIPVSGKYSVLMNTPGCSQDSSCGSRGKVNVTLYDSFGGLLSQNFVYQTNEYEKYDVLYTGNLDTGTQPVRVEMSLVEDSENPDPLYVVAQSIQLQYLQLELNEVFGNHTKKYNKLVNQTIGVNGIFEYSASNFTKHIRNPIGNTTINQIGSIFEHGATINQVLYNETGVILAGDFNSSYGNGILGWKINSTDYFTIDKGEFDSVSQIYGPLNEFIIAGESSLYSKAEVYESNTGRNENLNVSNSQPITDLSGFTFNGSEYVVIGHSNSSEIMDFTASRLFSNSTTFGMNVLSSLDSNRKDWMIDEYVDTSYIIGTILKFDLAANNIVESTSRGLSPVNITTSRFTAGAFIDSHRYAIAGSNIFLISNNKSFPLFEHYELDNTQVDTMIFNGSDLVIAFNGSATLNSRNITGLAYYNLDSSQLITLNQTFSGSLKKLTVDPELGATIGVGSFSVGDCSTICFFGNESDHLYVKKSVPNISGTINDAEYFNFHNILLGGNFTNKNEDFGYIGVYDTQEDEVRMMKNYSSQLPGPITSFNFVDETTNNKTLDDLIVVSGENYVGYFNGSKWTSLVNGLDVSHGSISSLSILNSTLSSFHQNKVILLTGDLAIDGYGNVTSAVYDGTKWTPYAMFATNLKVSDARAQNIVRLSPIHVFSGNFTSPIPSSSPSSIPTSNSDIQNKTKNFTNGQVVGVGFGLAVATLMLIAGFGFLLVAFTNREEEKIEGLKLIGEDRTYHNQQMMDVVDPDEIINPNVKKG